MIRCTFEILEWSLPRGKNEYGSGSITFKVTAHTENSTASQVVTTVAPRLFTEMLHSVLDSALKAAKQTYSIEGWVCPWTQPDDPVPAVKAWLDHLSNLAEQEQEERLNPWKGIKECAEALGQAAYNYTDEYDTDDMHADLQNQINELRLELRALREKKEEEVRSGS